MDMRIRTSLVTGGNRGLGLALVRHLLERGDHVIAACRVPGRATALNGLAGDDTLDGGTGSDVLTGGAGNEQDAQQQRNGKSFHGTSMDVRLAGRVRRCHHSPVPPATA